MCRTGTQGLTQERGVAWAKCPAKDCRGWARGERHERGRSMLARTQRCFAGSVLGEVGLDVKLFFNTLSHARRMFVERSLSHLPHSRVARAWQCDWQDTLGPVHRTLRRWLTHLAGSGPSPLVA
jgi:hypothetical protein